MENETKKNMIGIITEKKFLLKNEAELDERKLKL
jgi:hypothetical protein